MTYDQVTKHFKAKDVMELAGILSVRVQTIYNWRNKGIPRSRQLDLQDMTSGKLKADKK